MVIPQPHFESDRQIEKTRVDNMNGADVFPHQSSWWGCHCHHGTSLSNDPELESVGCGGLTFQLAEAFLSELTKPHLFGPTFARQSFPFLIQ